MHRIVQDQHLAADLDGVRDVERAADHLGHRLGDGRLAVAGLAVEEHRLGRVDGRAQHVEELRLEDQPAQALFHRIPGDPRVPDRLPVYPVDVLRERNRRRTDVRHRRHRLPCAGAALRREVEDVCRASVSARAPDLHQPAALEGEELIVQDGERELEKLGQLQAAPRPLDVQRPQHQVDEELGAEAGVLESLRYRRKLRLGQRPTGCEFRMHHAHGTMFSQRRRSPI